MDGKRKKNRNGDGSSDVTWFQTAHVIAVESSNPVRTEQEVMEAVRSIEKLIPGVTVKYQTNHVGKIRIHKEGQDPANDAIVDRKGVTK